MSTIYLIFEKNYVLDLCIELVSDTGSAGDTSRIKLEVSSESGFGTAVSDEAVFWEWFI